MKNKQNYFMFNLALSIIFCISFNISAMEPIGEAGTSSESGIMEPIGETGTSSESGIENKAILETRIKRLKDLYEKLINELGYEKFHKYENLSVNEYLDRQKLKKRIQKTIKEAENMYHGLMPINLQYINHNADIIEKLYPY